MCASEVPAPGRGLLWPFATHRLGGCFPGTGRHGGRPSSRLWATSCRQPSSANIEHRCGRRQFQASSPSKCCERGRKVVRLMLATRPSREAPVWRTRLLEGCSHGLYKIRIKAVIRSTLPLRHGRPAILLRRSACAWSPERIQSNKRAAAPPYPFGNTSRKKEQAFEESPS
jgi:hypothetical protein